MPRKKKVQLPAEGDAFAVPLDDGRYSVCRVLLDADSEPAKEGKNPMENQGSSAGDPYLSALSELREMIAELQNGMDQLLASVQLPKRFLSVNKAAHFCDLSPETIRRLLASDKLAAYRPVPGRVLVDRLELEAYVRSCTRNSRRGRGRKR